VDSGQAGERICSLSPIRWNNYDYYWMRKDMAVTSGGVGSLLCISLEEECLLLGQNSGQGKHIYI